jgi:pyridoxine 5'-phosphate synthase PdxJ
MQDKLEGLKILKRMEDHIKQLTKQINKTKDDGVRITLMVSRWKAIDNALAVHINLVEMYGVHYAD